MFLAGAFGWGVAMVMINSVYSGRWTTVINVSWGVIEVTHLVAFVLFC